jgi:hypothetical protein
MKNCPIFLKLGVITENYISYCNNKFNKIIHHDTNHQNNLLKNNDNIIETIKLYKNKFVNIQYPDIWNYNLTMNINNIESLQNNISLEKNIFPSYISNKPNNNEFKLYIYYKNNNENNLYDKKIITYNPSYLDTIDKLKDLIISELNINKYLLNIYIHPDIYINDIDKNIYFYNNNNTLKYNILLNDLLLKFYNFLIIEINSSNIKKI